MQTGVWHLRVASISSTSADDITEVICQLLQSLYGLSLAVNVFFATQVKYD